jgi:RimJ/RimL family protein N-acetyltransferase
MIDPAQVHRHAPLATTNLRLDRLGPEHLEGSYSASRDPETRRLSGNHNDDTREQYETRLAVQRDSRDRADWAILRASDGVYVGEASLFRFDVHNQSMEFQIALGGPALFGRGYGSEAAKAVVDYGFDVVGLHRITLQVVDFNTRAQRVYGKLGFHSEGVLREAWFADGEWSDVITMAAIVGH